MHSSHGRLSLSLTFAFPIAFTMMLLCGLAWYPLARAIAIPVTVPIAVTLTYP
jgi:hypothetical protein